MKSERVTFLAAPEFKTFLVKEAGKEGVSVGELIRRRCERRASDDEIALASLTAELRKAVSEAKKSLKAGLDEAQTVLSELSAARRAATSQPPARKTRRAAGAHA